MKAKKPFCVVYLPVGVPTFHLETAQKQFKNSVELLQQIEPEICCPNEMLLSLTEMESFLSGYRPDLIIFQNVTFANAAYATQAFCSTEGDCLLWTIKEPVIDGGRLRLNSLTGAYSAANALCAIGKSNFEYLFGAPDEEETKDALRACISASRLKKQLCGLKIAAVGQTPQGFGFGRALDSELTATFGAILETVEARELMDKAKSYTVEECQEYLNETHCATVGLQKTPESNLISHARLYKAYADYVKDNGIGALASRCWPDFFTDYGTPVCSVLSMLNERHVAASCEADVYGALSMFVGMTLTNRPVFFGDPVSMDEKLGTITYWHCGMAAPSLANSDGACVGVHPNRKIGPAMDFVCKGAERVTVLRIGRKPKGGFRLFVAAGVALETPKQFTGTSVVVATDYPAKELVCSSVQQGWEPHFVVAYGDIVCELGVLSRMLKLELCIF